MVYKNSVYKTCSSLTELGSQSLFSSVNKQIKRIAERRTAESFYINIFDMHLIINTGVYKTGIDTELMINVLNNDNSKTFLEVGCGCGAISIYLSKRSMKGLAVDINSLAVENSIRNAIENNINDLQIRQSDVFENVTGNYDLIICNPPYNLHDANDDIEKMFWDPSNNMKKKFFAGVNKFLNKTGKVFFGWADFNDLDFNFPIKTAEANGLKLIRTYSQSSKCSSYRFLVFEFHMNIQ